MVGDKNPRQFRTLCTIGAACLMSPPGSVMGDDPPVATTEVLDIHDATTVLHPSGIRQYVHHRVSHNTGRATPEHVLEVPLRGTR